MQCKCVCEMGGGVCVCVSHVGCNWTENESAACEYFSCPSVCEFCEWEKQINSSHLIFLDSALFSS